MAKTIIKYGYRMTNKQSRKLQKKLRENILARYDNEEYYNPEIIENFAQNNNLKK